MKGIHVTSDIGKLKRVLLHRPGRELLNLTPDTLEKLLFDDIPYLKEAQKEHDAFAKILKTNGVEFQDYNEPDYNKYFIKNNESFYYFEKLKDILKEENFEHKYRRLVDYLLNMNEKIKLANELIDIGDNEQLDEIIDLLDKGKDMLKDTIISGRLKDEKLMEYTLGTNEDISNTILRKEELDKGLIDVRQFVSYFEKNNTFQGDMNNKN